MSLQPTIPTHPFPAFSLPYNPRLPAAICQWGRDSSALDVSGSALHGVKVGFALENSQECKMVQTLVVQSRAGTSCPSEGKRAENPPSEVQTCTASKLPVRSLLAWRMEIRSEEYITSASKSLSSEAEGAPTLLIPAGTAPGCPKVLELLILLQPGDCLQSA